MGADYSIRFERRPADTGPPAAGPCCMLTAKTPLKALMALTSTRFAVLLGMPFGTHSVRFALRAALALVPAAPALSFAAVLPEASGDVPAANHASRPSTDVPGPPLPLPVTAPLRFAPGPGFFPSVHPLFVREILSFTPVFGPEGAQAFRPESFSVRLLSKMSHEARRYRERNVSEAGSAFQNDSFGVFDSAVEANRSAAASRVITRSSHRALSDELDRVARASLGLAPTLDLLQNLSLRRTRSGGPGAGAPAQGRDEAPAAAGGASRLRGDVGVRLDAHPALLFRAQFGALRGRIDLPMRNEPVRFSLESQLGARGRAVLSSGLPRDGQAWATLTFSFGF